MYKRLKTRLESSASGVFAEIFGKNAKLTDKKVEILRGFMRSLMDISSEAKKCHFAGHSLYQPGKPYLDLEGKMVQIVENYCKKTENDPISMKTTIEGRNRMLNFVFFPCTVAKIEETVQKIELSSAKRYFLQRISGNFHHFPANPTPETVNFALFLGISPSNLSQMVEIDSYFQSTDPATRDYINKIAMGVGGSEYGEDLVLEVRKKRVGISFREEVVY